MTQQEAYKILGITEEEIEAAGGSAGRYRSSRSEYGNVQKL